MLAAKDQALSAKLLNPPIVSQQLQDKATELASKKTDGLHQEVPTGWIFTVRTQRPCRYDPVKLAIAPGCVQCRDPRDCAKTEAGVTTRRHNSHITMTAR